MAEQLWVAPTNVTSPISGVTINSGAGNLGSEYDNETNRHQMASFSLAFQHGSAPTAGRLWLLYLLYAIDGTNYEDGDGSTQPRKRAAAVFPVRAVTTAQRVTVHVPILPFKLKPLVWNGTDQNSSTSAVTLSMEVYGVDNGG